MSFGWDGSGSECVNGHFKMEIPKTGFHDIIPQLMHLFYPQISTHSRMFRTNSSAGGRVWNCVAPEKGMNVKTLISHPHARGSAHTRTHTHTQPAVFFSQSFAILPSLPNVELLRCVSSTRVVERRKVSAHPLWPPPHKSSLSHSPPGLSERKHRTALCTDTGPYKYSADIAERFFTFTAFCHVGYIF